jgi:hypothetical protein
MRDRRGAYRVLVGRPKEMEDICIDGRIILKWFFKKWDEMHGMDCSGSVQGQVAGLSECGNEPSGSINMGNFFTS